MDEDCSVAWYDNNSDEVADRYESLLPASLHSWLVEYLPTRYGSTVLDVGAGTGRDAAWLAGLGYEVVAVEPSKAMRNQASKYHPDTPVHWIDDRLPELGGVRALRKHFDLILLNAVWMHIPSRQRSEAFRVLCDLLQPSGVLATTLRQGPVLAERGIWTASVDEIECLARGNGLLVATVNERGDQLGRREITWVNVTVRAPGSSPCVV